MNNVADANVIKGTYNTITIIRDNEDRTFYTIQATDKNKANADLCMNGMVRVNFFVGSENCTEDYFAALDANNDGSEADIHDCAINGRIVTLYFADKGSCEALAQYINL